jgi:hypothetical protein
MIKKSHQLNGHLNQITPDVPPVVLIIVVDHIVIMVIVKVVKVVKKIIVLIVDNMIVNHVHLFLV